MFMLYFAEIPKKKAATKTIKIETCFAGVSWFGFELLFETSRFEPSQAIAHYKIWQRAEKNKFVSTTFLFSCYAFYALKSLIQPKFRDAKSTQFFAECAH